MADQTSEISGDSFRRLDASELELFNRLREAMPALVVFAQVNMSQVYYLHSRRVDSLTKFGDIGRKNIDFLLCRRDDNSIVAAVALKEMARTVASQADPDAAKFAALKMAGIPLVVYARDKLPEVHAIRNAVTPLIGSFDRYARAPGNGARHRGGGRFL